MTWSDFLKYTKYIAIFYAMAFMIGIIGIWAQPHSQWIWTSVMFFGAALAANVALGSYHYNHKGSMLMAKNDYLAEQEKAQVITGESSKALEITKSGLRADMEDFLKDMIEDQVADELRRRRGY